MIRSVITLNLYVTNGERRELSKETCSVEENQKTNMLSGFIDICTSNGILQLFLAVPSTS